MLEVNEATVLELEAQQWSMEQPGFDEGIRAIQASLRDRSKTDRSNG
jgi:hypothetical protein